jgi:HK97 gp10 family phage protein
MGATLVSRIPAIQAGCVPKATAAVTKTVADIESGAKSMARVDTGNMRSSIQGQAGGLTGRVNAGAEYSIYNEYGTSKMSAQPFMTPAAEAAFPGFVSAMKSLT